MNQRAPTKYYVVMFGLLLGFSHIPYVWAAGDETSGSPSVDQKLTHMACELLGALTSHEPEKVDATHVGNFVTFFNYAEGPARKQAFPWLLKILGREWTRDYFLQTLVPILSKLQLNASERSALLPVLFQHDHVYPGINVTAEEYLQASARVKFGPNTMILWAKLHPPERPFYLQLLEDGYGSYKVREIEAAGIKFSDVIPSEELRFRLAEKWMVYHSSTLGVLDRLDLNAEHLAKIERVAQEKHPGDFAKYVGTEKRQNPALVIIGMPTEPFREFLQEIITGVKERRGDPVIQRLLEMGNSLSDDQLLELYKQLKMHRPDLGWNSDYLGNMTTRFSNIISPPVMVALLEMFPVDSYRFPRFFKDIREASMRRLVVETMLRIGGVGSLIEENCFSDYTPEEKATLFGQYVEKVHGDNLERLFKTLNIAASPKKFEILQKMAALGGHDSYTFLRQLGLSYEEFRDLVLLNAAKNPNAIVENLEQSGLTATDQAKLAEVLTVNGYPELLALHGYGLSESYRLSLLLEAIEKSGVRLTGNAINQITCFQNTLCHNEAYALSIGHSIMRTRPDYSWANYLIQRLGLTRENAQKLQHMAFGHDPVSAVRDILGQDMHAAMPFRGGDGQLDMRTVLQELASSRPDLLRAEIIDALAFPSQRRSNILGLLRIAYEQSDFNPQKVDLSQPYAVIERALGLDQRSLAKLSSNRRGDLLSIVYDLQHDTRQVPLGRLRFSGKMYQKDEMLDLLSALRDLNRMRNQDYEAMLAEFQLLDREIDAGYAKAATQKIRTAVVEEVVKMFGNTKAKITYEDYQKLRNAWGDLEPFESVVANFRSHGLPQLIELMGRVFELSAQDKFEEYKFNGDPENSNDQKQAAAQLESLRTDEQKAAWRKVRSRVAFAGKDVAKSGDEQKHRIELIRNTVRDNLRPHLLKAGGGRANAGLVEQILTQQAPPEIVWEGLLAGPLQNIERREAVNVMNQTAVEFFATSVDFASIKRLVSFLRGINREWVQELGFTEADVVQVKTDLNTISDHATMNAGSATEEVITFTTTTHHPKMMITVGDLVCVSSCQNYKTGGIVRTLPGYVIDANVQALVGYALRSSDFNSPADFDAIRAALTKNTTVEATLDGGKKMVTFKFQDGGERTIQTRPLGYALLRRILKIGAMKDGQPGIFAERAYEQSGPGSAIIAEQVQEILGEQRQAVGQPKGANQILVRQTRNNPTSGGGVYSDAGGGIKTTDYELQISE